MRPSRSAVSRSDRLVELRNEFVGICDDVKRVTLVKLISVTREDKEETIARRVKTKTMRIINFEVKGGTLDQAFAPDVSEVPTSSESLDEKATFITNSSRNTVKSIVPLRIFARESRQKEFAKGHGFDCEFVVDKVGNQIMKTGLIYFA